MKFWFFFPPKSYGTVSEVITAAFSQISAGGQRRWRGLQRAHRSVPRAHGPWNPSPWNGQRHESLEPLMFQEFSWWLMMLMMFPTCSNIFESELEIWDWMNQFLCSFCLVVSISTLGAYTYFPSRRPVTLDVQHGRPRLKIDAFGPLQADGNGALQLLTIQNVRWFMIQAWPPTAGRGPETWVTLGNCRISHLRSLLMFVEQKKHKQNWKAQLFLSVIHSLFSLAYT